jgi:WD40 repeat protein
VCGSNINATVTSLAMNAAGDHFFVGTNKSCMYLVAVSDFDYECRLSAHYARINQVVFPSEYSELFVTAGINDIRVWSMKSRAELLRINVPNLECLCLAVSSDGKSIISGWNDGKVRAFYPETGRLQYVIHDCHSAEKGGVTAIALSRDGGRLVTGGKDSLVRIWALSTDVSSGKVSSKMLASLREHQSEVSWMAMKSDDTEFVSASHDGSCVLWDLTKCSRLNALFASTQFECVLFHPDGSQLITAGTDRQIAYWDASDLSAIRVVDGSEQGALNQLTINSKGTHFVSVSEDRTVKLWHYDDGTVHAIGQHAHSGNILSCRLSPDNHCIVSVGDDAAICVWNMPPV